MDRLGVQFFPENKQETATFLVAGVPVIGSLMLKEYKFLLAWQNAVGSLPCTPEVEFDTTASDYPKTLKSVRNAAGSFFGRKFQLQETGRSPLVVAIEFDWDKKAPSTGVYSLSPITTPPITPSSTVFCPEFRGNPNHLEWWHFQWRPGYAGKTWLELLETLGYTREILAGHGSVVPPVFGRVGYGYNEAVLNKPAV